MGKEGSEEGRMSVLWSFVIGGVVGAVFALAKAPAPAPQNFEGVAGIVGIFAGWFLLAKVFGYGG
jgi:XapX domain-containing protein